MKKIVIVVTFLIIFVTSIFEITPSARCLGNEENTHNVGVEISACFFIESSKSIELESHSPIHINRNENFTYENGVISGNGTSSDPYIIENWDIDASNADGISIENTNVYFIIRNCIVSNGKNNNKDGIHLTNIKNGALDNITSHNNHRGIWLYNSSDNQIANCTIYDNCGYYGRGIDLEQSSNNQITNCVIHDNNWDGIGFAFSLDNLIINCTVYNNGAVGINLFYSSDNILRGNILEDNTYNFGVVGGRILDFYQDIDTSNTINGKAIYYVVEQSNLTFNGSCMNISYLGLVSCSNIVVKNLETHNNIYGIQLANTSSSILTNCTVHSNYYDGIQLYYSTNNQITKCTFYNNSDHGIELSFSPDNQISNCTIYNNCWAGINIYNSTNCQVNYCNIYDNTDYCLLSSSLINATYNWWGTASGPHHSTTNPSGTGNNVSDNVLYSPWLNAPVGVKQPPIVNVTYPINEQIVNGTITITGASSDVDGTVESVEIKIDNGYWQLAAGTTAWSFIWNTTVAPNGLHTIYTRAYDGLNYSDIKAVSVLVVNPVITQIISEPTTGANITAGYTGYGELNITVVVTPTQAPPEFIDIGIYINITALENITLSWVYIKVPYNEALLPKNIKEENLRLYYWNETTGEWKICERTDVDTVNNIVWANVTHLTIFAPMAEKVAEAQPAPVNWFFYIGITAIIVTLAVSFVVVRRRQKKSSGP